MKREWETVKVLLFEFQKPRCGGKRRSKKKKKGEHVPEPTIPGSPGQEDVLLHMRVSRRAPLQSVPYGEETHERVLTCQPWPHVREHTLHCDHSSAAGSPVERGGIIKSNKREIINCSILTLASAGSSR